MVTLASRPPAIHQFHVGSAFGDGVTNAMLFIREVLQGLGFASEIYCMQVAPELAGVLRHAKTYPDAPDQILLLHHSLGHNHADWVESLQSRLIMVYHNITPPEFFPAGSPLRFYSELGRKQLAGWSGRFAGAIGDSDYNTQELLQLGYKHAQTIPLLINIDRLRNIKPDEKMMARLQGAFNMVFVGRIAENKCQHDLISIFSHLRRRLDVPARLVLAGDTSSSGYHSHLHALRDEYRLGGSMEFTGKITNAALSAIYRTADVYVSMSEHEGFGVPLIEAMAHDVPVIAYDSGAIAGTMGEGGLLLQEKDHLKIAALIKILSEEAELRRRVLLAQRRNLQRFEPGPLRRMLSGFLESLQVEVSVPPCAAGKYAPRIRLEGPFDSSYSLALVNREFARALRQGGVDVALHSTDGGGDYPPNDEFIRSDAECREMWRRGQEAPGTEILLRDLYPPRVSDMRAPANGLSNYAWEESGFPAEYVAQFNKKLTHVTVLSRYVRKVLMDSGVRIPVRVSGAGVDHLLKVKPVRPRHDLGPESFRFLHVSSCFPRKGADVLLEAFGQAFTRENPVSLIIKTFPNIHNRIEDQLADFHARYPQAARVVLINENIDEAEIAGLYQQCDALAAPSRGEGFGLPIAEAMLFGKPVITTAYGGQMDFCNSANAWLVDYTFDYAQTHMGQFNSVWAEPDVQDLARNLREVFEAAPGERALRARSGKESLLAGWCWSHVAARNLEAVEALDAGPALQDLPYVGWVTTWNARCGIAAYARGLSMAIPRGQLKVFANQVNEPLAQDEDYVSRCWISGAGESLDELYRQILAAGISVAVIQFNFGFFDLAGFGQLILRLKDAGIGVHVFFHATADIVRPGLSLSLRTIAAQLAQATRLYVHGVDDLNRMKALGLVDNVILFPHGSLASAPETARAVKPETELLACFGYMLPGKGFAQLIEAFGILRASRPDLRLLMLNASYPAPESEHELQQCRALIAASPHGAAIELVTDFLPDEEALRRLQAADLIVFPYQNTGESSSAAVRMGLASRRPVACTPLPIFRDVASVTFQLPGLTPVMLAEGISALLGSPADLEAAARRQNAWLGEHAWPAVSARLWNILRGCAAL